MRKNQKYNEWEWTKSFRKQIVGLFQEKLMRATRRKTMDKFLEKSKGPRGMSSFNFVKFENLIYMNLYTLLILNEIQ